MNKEELRQKRKIAYQEAKTRRKADPRYRALKEKLKQERKAKYQAYRQEQKDLKVKKREEKDAELMAQLKTASSREDSMPKIYLYLVT
jgi:hypothetical protein